MSRGNCPEEFCRSFFTKFSLRNTFITIVYIQINNYIGVYEEE